MSDYIYLERRSNSPDATLLLLLHGYNSNEADLFSFSSHIPNHYHVVSLQAPLSLGQGYAWFPIHFEENMERWTDVKEVATAISYVNDFLSFYANKNSSDNSNVVLLGFSQGAMLSYAVGLQSVSVKGIAALSGYLDPRFQNIMNINLKSVYVSHGIHDEVVPYSWAQQSVALLKERGCTPAFHSYPQGHGINQENLMSLIQWLVEQQ